MSDWIKINGVSSESMGIWVDTPPVPIMGHRRRTITQVGFDEDLSIAHDSYENVRLTVTFYTMNGVLDRDDMYLNDDIYAYIADATTLETSRFEGWYYKVQDVSEIAPIGTHNGKKVRYSVTFTVSPFKYKLNESGIALTSPFKYEGSIYGKPVISFTASGQVSIGCNGEHFLIYDFPDNTDIVVDSQRMITTFNGELMDGNTMGKYPMLAVGWNILSVERYDVEPRVAVPAIITPNTRRR